jgi:CBS domain-containing protein
MSAVIVTNGPVLPVIAPARWVVREERPMSATVRDVMTTRVVALRKHADYKKIVSALRQYRVSACPVLDEANRVIGVVSGADLLFKQTDPDYPPGLARLEWRLGEASKANAVTADKLMTAPAVSIDPDATVVAAARLMQDRRVKRLPVVDQEGRLAGIVSRSDVLSVFERSDADIWDEVTRVVIGAEFALDPDGFDVTVSSGIVTITGLVDRHETALRLLARVRHAEGVVGVRDRLGYQEES